MKKFLFLLCAFYFSFAAYGRSSKPIKVEPVEVPQAPISAAPVEEKPADEKPSEEIALSWDNKANRKAWSKTLISAIRINWATLSRAGDIGEVCKNFKSLSLKEQEAAFAEFFIAVMFYESAWDPTSRMRETTMDIDPITGSQVWSEGLFQLSYQDEQWIKCGFDWSKDKGLAGKDPKKTILNPHLNIDCGVRIMSRQVNKRGELLLKSGVYWAVLKEGGKYTKIKEIKAAVKKALPICGA